MPSLDPRPPSSVRDWLVRLATAARAALGPQLRAAFPFGSLAWGDFSPGVSDCDVLLLVDGPLAPSRRAALTVAVESCLPTGVHQGLELLVVTTEAARRFGSRPVGSTGYEYSYEAFAGLGWTPEVGGRAESDVCVDFGLAVSRLQDAQLLGPPATAWIGDCEPRALLPAARAELRWWLDEGGLDDHPDLYRTPILNACRAWRLADEGRLCSKLAGGEWALAHGLPGLAGEADGLARGRTAALVDASLRRQRGEAPGLHPPPPWQIEALLSFALARCGSRE